MDFLGKLAVTCFLLNTTSLYQVQGNWIFITCQFYLSQVVRKYDSRLFYSFQEPIGTRGLLPAAVRGVSYRMWSFLSLFRLCMHLVAVYGWPCDGAAAQVNGTAQLARPAVRASCVAMCGARCADSPGHLGLHRAS